MISADADDIRLRRMNGTDIISYCDEGAIYHAARQRGISSRASEISLNNSKSSTLPNEIANPSFLYSIAKKTESTQGVISVFCLGQKKGFEGRGL